MIYLKKLTSNDGMEIFDMLKEIDEVENSFTNPVHKMTYEQFQEWLVQQEMWSHGEALPDGYVGQSIYWLYENQFPIGIGKIRHRLTDASRVNGGNIGYSVRPTCRGKGHGNEILKLLLNEAKHICMDEILLTVDKGNYASRSVVEANGGVLVNENGQRWYFSIKKITN